MTKAILCVALLACAVMFAVPALAADATPTTATTPVAVASSIDQPVKLTAAEMDNTTGEAIGVDDALFAIGVAAAYDILKHGAIYAYNYCVSHGVFTKLKNYVGSHWNQLSLTAKAFFTVAHCR
jgi:hypothetical protein